MKMTKNRTIEIHLKSEILRNIFCSLVEVIKNYQRTSVLLLNYVGDCIKNLRKQGQKTIEWNIYCVMLECNIINWFYQCFIFYSKVKIRTIN